jgi:hypothetical protein
MFTSVSTLVKRQRLYQDRPVRCFCRNDVQNGKKPSGREIHDCESKKLAEASSHSLLSAVFKNPCYLHGVLNQVY